FDLFEFQKPVEVLESYGISRDDITDIILTHGHHDHIDALRYYPTASVFVHKDAVSSLMGYLPDYTKLQAVSDCAVVGRGITLQHIGGHALGSCVVLVKLAEKTLVFCGDECYAKESLTEGRLTGSSICPEKTRAFLEEYAKPCYMPILSHDPDLLGELGYRVLFEN
ncbi:MAG: MBL fold metallo-hydrolase, partial [Clostridia bacterium]|nr:MBL fold metallo-hydrolase [Clostridia bacterium]